jgi:hypothetical protein
MTKTSIAAWVLLFAAVVMAAFFWLNRPRRIAIDAPLPLDFPQQSFSHDSFEELLQTYVTAEGRVDYARWHRYSESRAQLDAYLAAVSRYSPDSAPERFQNRNETLAYWMYGYNAYVIKAVLDNWPINSVTDVKAPLEAIKGLGFFYQLRFSFGGEFLSLLSVENHKIREQYSDPRIHFVLNCASESCPIARPGLPVGDDLKVLLEQAAIEFINDSENVAVDHDKELVYLSTIFKWYKKDFVADVRLKQLAVNHALLAYIAQYAADDLIDDVTRARDYEIRYREYDWGLNSTN